MVDTENRWTLPDRASAERWCRERNDLGIRCIIDLLSGAATTPRQADTSREAYLSCIRSIQQKSLNASVSVKLTTIGAIFDQAFCQESALSLMKEADEREVGFELDMEGRGLVNYTLGVALTAAREGYPLTITLQAYLDRTPVDLEEVLKKDIRVRLVKGAYVGDTTDFRVIQERFKRGFTALLDSGKPFSAGTHDPDLIRWMVDSSGGPKEQVEFS
ncbi:MAG TPA: proline dehydrogenase family protein, partial [Methanomicrobiales archaeon]|nr:proline dehydrogenase family protein [Methanomicrobiales archaeon]